MSVDSADKRADRAYLREVAYAEPSGLAARSALYDHQHPRIDLKTEVSSCLGPLAGHTVADIGCGDGRYVHMLAATGAQVVGVDLSTGMLAGVPAPKPALVTADAQALPFLDASFDDVLMMHMLYHAPDPELAVTEAARVLREGGRCLVGVNGPEHLIEMNEIWLPLLNDVGLGDRLRTLGLVNARVRADDARALLGAAFGQVEQVRLRSRVVVTDPEPVIRHAASTAGADGTGQDREDLLGRFRDRIRDRIGETGDFRITTEVVLLLAHS